MSQEFVTSNMANPQEIQTNERLLAVCIDDQDAELEEILEKGSFDINYSDKQDQTAFHYAAKYGSPSCLDILVRVPNANLNAVDKDGNTPLHLAAQYRDPEDAAEMVDTLLNYGANPRIKNNNGKIISDLVVGDNDINELIKQAMAPYETDDSDDDVD